MIGERAERATESILLKMTPTELADIDRIRGARPRTVFIKTYMRAVVKQHDRLEVGNGGRDQASSGTAATADAGAAGAARGG